MSVPSVSAATTNAPPARRSHTVCSAPRSAASHSSPTRRGEPNGSTVEGHPRTHAPSADAAVGINHSTIFGEYFASDLSGFGSNDVMNVGSNTFVFGVMLEI